MAWSQRSGWNAVLVVVAMATALPVVAQSSAVDTSRQQASANFNFSEPNYFLFGLENRGGSPLPPGQYANQIKFRVAVRYRALALMNRDYESGIHIGYRQNSFWHLWEPSAPFFDNNYNPQAFVYFDSRDYRRIIRAPSVRLFAEHESNGRDGPESRSWNRYGAGVDFGDYKTSRAFASARIWRAFSVSEENADIRDYAGRGEFNLALQPLVKKGYPLGSGGVSTRMRLGGRQFITNVEVNVFLGTKAVPIRAFAQALSRLNASLIAQYFNGTGENLLSYRERHSGWRIGLATVR